MMVESTMNLTGSRLLVVKKKKKRTIKTEVHILI